MAERDIRDFVADMVEAVRSIQRFVEGMTLDEFMGDEKTRYAVMRGTSSRCCRCWKTWLVNTALHPRTAA